MPAPAPPVNLHAYEAAAADILPRTVFDYYAGGAGDEVLLRTTRAAWDAITLRYRVLRDVSVRSQRTTLLGDTFDWPVLVAPMAFQQLAHAEGELATMRAVETTGSGMILSTLATRSVEELRSHSRAPLWFQLYIYKDRGATAALVQRAEAAGCTALVLTVDAPILGRRERDLINGFQVPADQWDPSISWKDLAWLRSITRLPIVVKGIVRGDDAVLALEHGAAGVIVSNHGGRQLDTAVPTARALPEVADAMGGRGVLLADGGIRRGTDVVKALALGAQAVLLGRPVLWGLALDGAAGAERVLQLLKDECDLALALCGCRTPAEATRDLIAG